MKKPEEYVQQAGGRQRDHIVTRAAAEAAVAQALADAERYKELLLASLRKRPSTETLCRLCHARFVEHPDAAYGVNPNDPPF
jgi:regulator of protease activity HflC (stomatin/prohibitin superfamily)